MKLVMGVLLFLSPLFANALDCTDFSGEWMQEDFEPIVIEQVDCSGFSIGESPIVFGQANTYAFEGGSATDMFAWDADQAGLHLDTVAFFKDSDTLSSMSNSNMILTLDGESTMKLIGKTKSITYTSGIREETSVDVESVFTRL